MALTDPIADLLTRIRNAQMARRDVVVVPGSKLKRELLERLREEGYVGEVSWEDDGKQGQLIVRLKYDGQGEAVVDGLRRISKPGRRVFVGVDEIPKAQSGYGTVILSTSKGVLTDKKARELRVGGEVLCSIW
ncbi:MAG: 30S ribosomal protein S8 [Desulfuromonadales bacterium]|nr:30S ribosomal protein S8 [Desulfuromonadales bacterium]